MIKVAADHIANEMFALLKKKASEASLNSDVQDSSCAKVDDASDKNVSKENEVSDEAENELSDYLLSEEEKVDDDSSYMDDEIKDMQHMAEDELMRGSEGSHDAGVISNDPSVNMLASASDIHLMEGLGKIEASLRSKGEGFAADLVRTTALSIQDDIIKEASKKSFVIKNLLKMSADLNKRGEKKAADLVNKTIDKIKK